MAMTDSERELLLMTARKVASLDKLYDRDRFYNLITKVENEAEQAAQPDSSGN